MKVMAVPSMLRSLLIELWLSRTSCILLDGNEMACDDCLCTVDIFRYIVLPHMQAKLLQLLNI